MIRVYEEGDLITIREESGIEHEAGVYFKVEEVLFMCFPCLQYRVSQIGGTNNGLWFTIVDDWIISEV